MTKQPIYDDAGIDLKIIAAFERISQAIRTLAWKTGNKLLLKPIQVQVLLFLLHHGKAGSRITSLAKEFDISKASISETISSLERKGLIHKIYPDGDTRNFNIQLTNKGRQAAKEATSYAQALLLSVNRLGAADKQQLFAVLGGIISDLHASGVITVQRMCQTCKYYDRRGEIHYCQLLERRLGTGELQIDCADHQQKL